MCWGNIHLTFNIFDVMGIRQLYEVVWLVYWVMCGVESNCDEIACGIP